MKLLAIETSSSACSLALSVDGEVFQQHKVIPMQHAQQILPMLDALLKTAHCKLQDVDAIAFGRGPGSFTGLRIAASLSQGLSYALQCPIIPVSSLSAIAHSTYAQLGWKHMLVAIDARIQEVYWAAYEIDDNGLPKLVGLEHVSPPQSIALPNPSWSGVGNAWDVYKNEINVMPENVDASITPNAASLLPIALFMHQQQQWVSPSEALPVYLRNSVAKKMP